MPSSTRTGSTPEMTAEEESTVVVVFKGVPNWNLREFASRLEWYASGLWPTGQVEGEVDEILDMMVRDYLVLKAADDLGLTKDPNFLKRLSNREREMKVTYFYYNDIMKNVNPTQEDIEAWFADHRENYKLPPSYKVSFFTSKDKGLIERLAADWKSGSSFGDLQKKYGPKDAAMEAMGETPWVYQGRDPVIDEMVAPLQDGEVSAPMTRADMTMVLKLVSRQGERIPAYEELKERHRQGRQGLDRRQGAQRLPEGAGEEVRGQGEREGIGQVHGRDPGRRGTESAEPVTPN